MTGIMEHVEHGFRFLLAPGGTFINVKRADDKSTDPPYDMMEVPNWITRSSLDEEGFQLLCSLWMKRMTAEPSQSGVTRADNGDATATR